MKKPEADKIQEALNQWEQEKAARIADFTLACASLLHGEAMTVTQVKAMVEEIAEGLRATGRKIEQ